jgi:hypothetical protein
VAVMVGQRSADSTCLILLEQGHGFALWCGGGLWLSRSGLQVLG